MVRAALFGLLAVTDLIISACSGSTRTGTQYTLLPNRHIQANIGAEHHTVHETALDVANDMGFTINESAVDDFEGVIRARTAGDDSVSITSTRIGPNATEIDIFVGPLGKEDRAREILTRIEDAM